MKGTSSQKLPRFCFMNMKNEIYGSLKERFREYIYILDGEEEGRVEEKEKGREEGERGRNKKKRKTEITTQIETEQEGKSQEVGCS